MPLTNLTFVNTRPESQAETLSELLTAMGAQVINFPSLEIQPAHTKITDALCQQLEAFDTAIFLSANAILHSHNHWPNKFPISTVIAVGPGTQKTLKRFGITTAHMPNQFNSEGILEMPALSQPKGKNIIIFCGENPRPLLHETLAHQGATVTLCECYQRVCPKLNTETLARLQSETLNGIISTSKESLTNLNTLLKDNSDIKKTLLLVISSPMEALAKQQGWEHVVTAPNASNEAIVETLNNIF